MALLGGKGTLAGPIVGAIVFQLTKELFWTYLLGWQRVALGVLIVAVAVFFPAGIVGFVRERLRRPRAREGTRDGDARARRRHQVLRRHPRQ